MTVVCACVMVLRPFCRRHLPFLLGTHTPAPNANENNNLHYDGPTGPKSKSAYRTKVSGGSCEFKRSGGNRSLWSGFGKGTTLKEDDDDMESLSAELNTLPPQVRSEREREGSGVDAAESEKAQKARAGLRDPYPGFMEGVVENGIVKTVSLDIR